MARNRELRDAVDNLRRWAQAVMDEELPDQDRVEECGAYNTEYPGEYHCTYPIGHGKIVEDSVTADHGSPLAGAFWNNEVTAWDKDDPRHVVAYTTEGRAVTSAELDRLIAGVKQPSLPAEDLRFYELRTALGNYLDKPWSGDWAAVIHAMGEPWRTIDREIETNPYNIGRSLGEQRTG